MILSVLTPEKSVTHDLAVEAIIVPGELGQMTLLPGHTDILSSMTPGSFAYKAKGEWSWAFLSGGFVQVCHDKVTVLAETMEFSHEVDLAAVELDLKEFQNKLKNIQVTSSEYPAIKAQKDLAEARFDALKNKKV